MRARETNQQPILDVRPLVGHLRCSRGFVPAMDGAESYARSSVWIINPAHPLGRAVSRWKEMFQGSRLLSPPAWVRSSSGGRPRLSMMNSTGPIAPSSSPCEMAHTAFRGYSSLVSPFGSTMDRRRSGPSFVSAILVFRVRGESASLLRPSFRHGGSALQNIVVGAPPCRWVCVRSAFCKGSVR